MEILSVCLSVCLCHEIGQFKSQLSTSSWLYVTLHTKPRSLFPWGRLQINETKHIPCSNISCRWCISSCSQTFSVLHTYFPKGPLKTRLLKSGEWRLTYSSQATSKIVQIRFFYASLCERVNSVLPCPVTHSIHR